MSCNGCRILRKGCSENCLLKQSLQKIESPQAQANATVFVAKFYGRAGLISFLSSVPESQRPALFESLLYEACGRTVNPVTGAVGLLSAGKWNLCQAAATTVLEGGVLFQEEHNNDSNDVSNLEDVKKWDPDDHQSMKRRPAPATPEESETTTLESSLEHKPFLRLFP